MDKCPNRTKNVWIAWLRKQWNCPSRTDHYLMQLSADVRNLFSSRPVDIDDRLITWSFDVGMFDEEDEDAPLFIVNDVPVSPPGPMTAEDIAEFNRIRWLATVNAVAPPPPPPIRG